MSGRVHVAGAGHGRPAGRLDCHGQEHDVGVPEDGLVLRRRASGSRSPGCAAARRQHGLQRRAGGSGSRCSRVGGAARLGAAAARRGKQQRFTCRCAAAVCSGAGAAGYAAAPVLHLPCAARRRRCISEAGNARAIGPGQAGLGGRPSRRLPAGVGEGLRGRAVGGRDLWHRPSAVRQRSRSVSRACSARRRGHVAGLAVTLSRSPRRSTVVQVYALVRACFQGV